MIGKGLRFYVVVALLALPLAVAPGALAAPGSCENRNNNNHAKLLECVTLEGVREHQAAFQAIADANGDNRASGLPGYEASVDYVVERMTAAGYNVTLHTFAFDFQPDSTLRKVAPPPVTDYGNIPFVGSATGDVTASVTAVDLQLGPGNTNTSGCEAADFAGFPAGNIALIQRGACNFSVKVQNAEAAGAVGVVIFNAGDTATPDRNDLFGGTLAPFTSVVPVVGASYSDGATLAGSPGLIVQIIVPESIPTTIENVIAESKSGNPNNVVMAGAHLDSVQQGPGINDNGSGSAALLEVAEQMQKVKPRNMVRFAWWGAEEAGLVGSTEYVNSLSQAERDRIAVYLNFDMVGSPNYGFFIYDGDDSDATGEPAGPAGSAQIEKTFERYYTSVGEAFRGTDFTGRSDYGPFIAVGIPSGGLFTGAEGIKTAEEAALWGGTAGQQYDPCYHQACDTYANNSDHALSVNADAIAYAILQYAMNTSDVNGKKGKGNFKVPGPVVPSI